MIMRSPVRILKHKNPIPLSHTLPSQAAITASRARVNRNIKAPLNRSGTKTSQRESQSNTDDETEDQERKRRKQVDRLCGVSDETTEMASVSQPVVNCIVVNEPPSRVIRQRGGQDNRSDKQAAKHNHRI